MSQKKLRRNCLNCGKQCNRPEKFYCNNCCQSDKRYSDYIFRWKLGLENGLNGNVVSRHIKRYLREKHNNGCQKCKWGELNRFTQIVPLEAHHINGDWQDNREENLELLCPNCHSLTQTYKNSNKGMGRPGRLS